ncbi:MULTISPECIES: glycosyltransferase family 4 protein [unclassified Carboxylicivirga]|uniref:glycosyltransferase family 4 protein n=1 Tax=Carboxylicivirga TaxID=1628153 RepID=UPI003D33FD46
MKKQTPKRKILIFIDWFLPGYKAGGPVRSMANMVEYLKDDYAFYIVTRNTDYTETTPYTGIESNTWVDFSPHVKVFYADEAHQDKKNYRNLIREMNPNAVYINGVYSWKFSILPLMVAKKAGAHQVIVAARGMLAASAIDVKEGKKKLFLRLARLADLYKNTVFHATNEKEKQDIKDSLGKNIRIKIADNLPKSKLPAIKPIAKQRGNLRLVSLARIAPEKNTLFALEQLAGLGHVAGNITFHLYGQVYNESYWQQCQTVMAQLPDNIQVEHMGTVDADLVGETIQQYHALYLPTRGENFGHVILESLSAGRPVLISDQTPWRGLINEKAGWDISLELKSGKVDELNVESASRVQCPMSGVRGPESESSAWCAVIRTLLEMEREEFDSWCTGARNRAEAFVYNPALKEAYRKLFD